MTLFMFSCAINHNIIEITSWPSAVSKSKQLQLWWKICEETASLGTTMVLQRYPGLTIVFSGCEKLYHISQNCPVTLGGYVGERAFSKMTALGDSGGQPLLADSMWAEWSLSNLHSLMKAICNPSAPKHNRSPVYLCTHTPHRVREACCTLLRRQWWMLPVDFWILNRRESPNAHPTKPCP